MNKLSMVLVTFLVGSISYADALKAKMLRINKAELSIFENARGTQVLISGTVYTLNGENLQVNVTYYNPTVIPQIFPAPAIVNCLAKAKKAQLSGNGLLVEGLGTLKSLRSSAGKDPANLPRSSDGTVVIPIGYTTNSDTFYFDSITRCEIIVNKYIGL